MEVSQEALLGKAGLERAKGEPRKPSWDSSRTVVVIKLRRTSALTVTASRDASAAAESIAELEGLLKDSEAKVLAFYNHVLQNKVSSC